MVSAVNLTSLQSQSLTPMLFAMPCLYFFLGSFLLQDKVLAL